MKILITGFPYVRESYFATFRFWPDKDQLVFLLPRSWKAKGGKVVFHPPKDTNVFTASAFFYHSHYPVIGGLLKGWMPAFPLFLYRKRKEVGLVYTCGEPHLLTTLYNGIFTRLAGKKHVIFTWENIPYWRKFSGLNWWFKKAVIKMNLALSDGVICGNKKGAEIYKQLTLRPCSPQAQKPIAVIPMNGVDPDFFSPLETRNLKLKTFGEYDWSGKTVFTFVGAIGYRKGIHLIVQAFSDVLKEMPDAHLVIAGSGEYEKEIESMMRENKVEKHATRIPWISHDKLVPLLSASDVFLYPSLSYGGWEEQFGYSMAEASLMELPVISTRSGSIEDVVIDGQTGVLVPPDNALALRDAMLRLGKDAALRKKLGQAGRQYIAQNFSHHVIARKFSEFFNRLLSTQME